MTNDDDKPLTPAQARQKLQQGLADYLAGKGSESDCLPTQTDQEGQPHLPAQAHPATTGDAAPMHAIEPEPEEEDRAGRGRHADRPRHLERTAQAQR